MLMGCERIDVMEQQQQHESVGNLREKLERDGFVKIPRSVFCLDGTTVEELRAELEGLFDGHYSTGIYPDEIHWRRGISRDDATRELCNAWKASSLIRRIVGSPQLGKLACELGNWTSCRIAQDDVLWKPANSSKASSVGFHRDGAYISDNFEPSENNCLTLWMALDDSDLENGTLQYAKGSHQWKKSTAETVEGSSFHVANDDDDDESNAYLNSLKIAARDVRLDFETDVTVETVDVPKGELLVHHQDVWHGSPPNVSLNRLRRALVVHLLRGDVAFRKHPSPHYIYGRYYIRGETELREDFFPVTYSRSSKVKRTSWLDGE